MDTTSEDTGAIPLLESVDSLKLVGEHVSVLPREKVFRTQTPQAFKRAALLEIMKSRHAPSTDEATLWLDAGRNLVYVKGSEKNFKITTDFDWIAAKAMTEAGRTIRMGMGYDVHELIPGRRLILGGVEIISPLGLLGYSDADIICHAISDALLGASGERDIGTIFPASDDRYKDADSSLMLKQVLELLAGMDWAVTNVDVTLVAQIPRLGDKINGIADNLKRLFMSVGLYTSLNVKVKSGEQIGSVGRAECMVCFAAAVIEKYEMWEG
jgi:2-C-methyl-D-erythritol 4-phosphate cytidylyltransferase/2-C-methyl-D-erythritol 2,4-cyclodiphosphate synthase